MTHAQRIQAAGRVAGWHLLLSLVAVLGCAFLVFGFWYPSPYHQMLGIWRVMALLAMVDVICGPLLTLVLYDPGKERWKWAVDLALIAAIQLSALTYGMDLMQGNRPVFLALEGDRFRLIQRDHLPETPMIAKGGPFALDWSAPRAIGVRLLRPGDPGYVESIEQAAAGVHPAFRPDRWVPYTEQVDVALQSMKPLADLRSRANPDALRSLESLLREKGLKEDEVGYLPLASDMPVDWSVLISKGDGHLVGIVAISGWAS